MDDKTQQKLTKLQDLLEKKKLIDLEISAILSPERVVALPPNFSLNNEIHKIVQEASGAGISKTEILQSMKNRFSTYGIDRKKVASALAYLKNTKKSVEIIGRGMYRALSASPESSP